MATIHPADNHYWVDAYRYRDAEVLYYSRTRQRILHDPKSQNPCNKNAKKAKGKDNEQNIAVRVTISELPSNQLAYSTSEITTSSNVTNKKNDSGAKKKRTKNKNKGELNNTGKDALTCQVRKGRSQEQTENVKTERGNTLIDRVTKLELEKTTLQKTVASLLDRLQKLEVSVKNLVATTSSSPSSKEPQLNGPKKQQSAPASTPSKVKTTPQKKDENDDVDLFGSDSESEDEAKAKIREERLVAYHAKKAKKPSTVIAKSSIILDVKPWDDETDMKQLETVVRSIEHDGLLWGASKLVPLAYGIHKLQINCVIEDEKVSVDWLQETIESKGSDHVQSVDIAAFNKI